jgi:hypothetical protein
VSLHPATDSASLLARLLHFLFQGLSLNSVQATELLTIAQNVLQTAESQGFIPYCDVGSVDTNLDVVGLLRLALSPAGMLAVRAPELAAVPQGQLP